jgi:hypothetical protein
MVDRASLDLKAVPARLNAIVRESSPLMRLVTALVCAVTIERAWLGVSLPLWLDETWTAMIATRPDWASFWREAWLDVNAPFYYLFMKLWVGVAGTSNEMLRLPSLLFFYAAAALPLMWRAHGLNRTATVVWGALILLWWPGIAMTLDARTYGLLLFASVAGAIAFMQAMRDPRPAYFLLWAAIGSVQLLSHYFAYFLVALQGLLLLSRWRLHLVRHWYAFLPFVIPLGWTIHHFSRVQMYGQPGIAWYDPTDLAAAVRYTMFSFGPPSGLFAAILVLALGGALWKSNWQYNPGRMPLAESAAPGSDAAIRWTIGGAIATLAFLLVFSSIKASLTDRYVVPMVPSMLLAMVVLASRIGRSELAYTLMVLVYGVFALTPSNLSTELNNRSNYGYERASDFLEADRPDRLIFIWDHSNTQILDEASLARIGDFFLLRNGLPVETEALRLSRFDDPNEAIRKAVKSDRTAVIWLYDAQRSSAARLHPPRLANDPAWRCRDKRSYLVRRETMKRELWVGTLACTTVTGGVSK